MRRSPNKSLGFLLLLMPWALGCSESATAPGTTVAPDALYATTFPLEWAADRLLEGHHDVQLALDPGADPAHWTPSRELLRELQRAGSIAVNGAGLEGWLESASLPRSRIVETTRRFAGRLIEGEGVTHSHGPSGGHSHAPLLPRVWLDPNNLNLQVAALAEAYASQFPDHEGSISAARKELDRELRDLDRAWLELAPALRERRVLVAGDSYAYLAERYGFETHGLVDGPTAEDLILVDGAEQQANLDAGTALVARLDSHGARPSADADYLALVRADLESLRRLLEEHP